MAKRECHWMGITSRPRLLGVRARTLKRRRIHQAQPKHQPAFIAHDANCSLSQRSHALTQNTEIRGREPGTSPWRLRLGSPLDPLQHGHLSPLPEHDDTTPAGQGSRSPAIHRGTDRRDCDVAGSFPASVIVAPRPNMFPTRCYWPALSKYSCPGRRAFHSLASGLLYRSDPRHAR